MVFRHFATKEELYSAILDHKACLHDEMDPLQRVAQAIERKDDQAVFEGIALEALNHHEDDPEFQRLLLHSALEQHELAHMFCEKFVRRVYRSLGNYIRERGNEVVVEPTSPSRASRRSVAGGICQIVCRLAHNRGHKNSRPYLKHTWDQHERTTSRTTQSSSAHTL